MNLHLRLFLVVSTLFFACQSLASGSGHTATKPVSVNQAVTTLPFELQDRLIVVNATINGVNGNYLFDTGAQITVLNSTRFSDDDIETFELNHAQPSGAGGTMNEVRATRGLELEWSGIRMEGLMAAVTDLSHLEKNIGGIEVKGIIGFNVLEKFQMHFDYANQEITLLALDSNGDPLDNPFTAQPEQSIDFEMAGHIPVFPVEIGGLELLMGLDSGAAGQMIFTRHRDSLDNQYEFIETSELKGADLNVQKGDVVRIPSTTISELSYPDMTYRFNDLAAHHGQAMPFDGLLGYEFLQNRPTALNLRKQQIMVWPVES